MRSTRCRSARAGSPAAIRRPSHVATDVTSLSAVSKLVVAADAGRRPPVPDLLTEISTGLGAGVELDASQAVVTGQQATAAGVHVQIVETPLAIAHLDVIPVWLPQARRLFFQGIVVKEFRQPAGNQEIVLAAFQDQGWPPRIDDPLPRDAGPDDRERMHNTLRRLNRQRCPLLWFESDGFGLGFCWKLR